MNDEVMINLDNAMNKAIVFGNGESRKWCDNPTLSWHDIPTWGCNAIYRDMWVDNLVSVDYAMQQEIYEISQSKLSYTLTDTNYLHFANWSPIPAEIADMMFNGWDIPEEFVHKNKSTGKHTEQCVVSGKDPAEVNEKVFIAKTMNPSLDMKDLRLKMEKDMGIWITYLGENDNVKTIDFPVGWSAGTTALHLACQEVNRDSPFFSSKEVYMLGFDLSSYDESLNNIYKGTDNYLPSDAKGFNSVNWLNQMHTVFGEFKDTTFYWVDPIHRAGEISNVKFNNVRYLTKEELCVTLNIR